MSTLDRVGIYGMGNVGSALLMELAHDDPISHRIEVASRNPSHVMAAVLDVASVFPDQADSFTGVEKLEGEYDLVVIAAGEQPSPEVGQTDHLERNVTIAQQALKGAGCETAVVVGSPVDRLTERLSYADIEDFRANYVIGFGGELDKARAQYALNKRGISAEEVFIIGEHGSRAIPVYAGEEDYEAIKKETTQVLKTIKEATGKARNLATGVQLARLIRVLSSGEPEVMCISYYEHEGQEVNLTWPNLIKGTTRGVEPVDISDILGPKAQKDFDQLLTERQSTLA